MLIWVKVFKNGPSKIYGRQPLVCLGRSYHFKFLKSYFPQILLGPFLNNLTKFCECRILPFWWLPYWIGLILMLQLRNFLVYSTEWIMEVLAEMLQGLDRMGVSLIIKRNGWYHVGGHPLSTYLMDDSLPGSEKLKTVRSMFHIDEIFCCDKLNSYNNSFQPK